MQTQELKTLCTFNKQHFIRKRILTFPVLVTYIINLIRKSLQVEISSFCSFLDFSDVSKQAFSQARKKLSSEVFTVLNKKFITEFYTNNIYKQFKGLRLLAVDGSTIRLPESEELYEKFGAHPRKGSVPLAQTSVLYDVLNHVTLHATLQPYGTPEKSMALEHFVELDALNGNCLETFFQDLLIFDRGYLSHFLMYYLKSKNKHFLARAYKNFSDINRAVDSGIQDIIIDIPLTKDKLRLMPDFQQYLPDLKEKNIKVRVSVYLLPNGEQEILVSSLINQSMFTYNDIFNLYAKRWNIEEHYKLYKCVTNIENFSGKSPLIIKQDFYATVLTCNIALILAQEAQDEVEALSATNKQTKYMYKINRNILIGTIKNEILILILGDHDITLYCEKLKRRFKRSLVAIRPNRRYPRISCRRFRWSTHDKECL